MFRFLKITMLDRVYVRATSTERRHVACAGLKFFFHNGVILTILHGKGGYHFPNSSKLHRKPSEDRVIS